MNIVASKNGRTPFVRALWFGPKGKVALDEGDCDVYDANTHDIDWTKTLQLIPEKIK